MKSHFRLMAVVLMGFSLLGCNLNSALAPVVPAPTSVSEPVVPQSVEAPEFAMEGDEDDDIDMSPTPTTEGQLPEENLFDICTLISPSDAEGFLAEPVSEPGNLGGICIFKNARDGLYTFSVSAAQDEEAVSILEGQASLLSASGIQMDETNLNEVKSLADQLDYRGVFTKLATTAKDSSAITAKLFAGGGNDIAYWSWATVPPRQQGSFVAVRNSTVVNINLKVSESIEESVLLKQCNSFAGSIFERLPGEFSVFSTMNEEDTLEPTPTSETAVENQSASAPAETLVVQGLSAPILVSPDDDATFSVYPRATTLLWEPVDGAAKYLVEIMACATNDTNTCFSHPMLEKTTRETIETMYSFNFVGEQSGKWRVTPIDASGELGNPSEWRTFQYTE